MKTKVFTLTMLLMMMLPAAFVAAEPVGDIEVEGTLDIRGPVLGLDIFKTVAGDSGSAVASGPITTINIVGGTGVVTSVSGTTLTISVGAYDSGGVARLGHAGGQEVYGGTGEGENLVLGSTINATKGAVIVGTALNPLLTVDETTLETTITGGTLIIQ